MPFIEDVEEARQKIASVTNERIGEVIDAENLQDNDECNLIGNEVHPDFQVHDPDFFHGGIPQRTVAESSYSKIALWDNKEIRAQLRKLDPDQRYVVDRFTKYARQFRLAEDKFCTYPGPPLLIVEEDTGSGKSEVIKILCQV